MEAPRGAVLDPPQVAWVDEFIRNVRPYVFVREEDRLLIKRPNRAQKLNAPGAAILKALLDGRSIGQVLDETGREPRRVHDVLLFLREVRRSLEGTLREENATHAVEVRPFELGFSGLPVLSEVALTYRCNLRCSFCYAGCNCTANPAGADREMSGADVRRVLKTIALEAQVPSVSFTGGEAALRPELPEFVRFAKGLGMYVNLVTNGTLVTPDLAARLAGAGLDSAQVSLEGTAAAAHDAATRVPGSFGRTLAGVRNFRAAGVRVHTHSTIHRGNLEECLRMPRFVRDGLGLPRFSMNLVIPAGSAALDGGTGVSYSEVGPVLEGILAESRRCGVEFMWYSPTPLCLFNPVVHGLGNKGCAACDGLLSVAADGQVLPCSSCDDPVGSLLERPVRELWGSEKARRYREKSWAPPGCRRCEHFALCQCGCPLYWRRAGFGELRPAARSRKER